MTALAWLVPVFVVGAVVILLSRTVGTLAHMDTVFLGAMSIGSIVLTASRDVAVFLVDVGLLFEEFFSRVSRLVIPAFAFVHFLFAYRNPLRLGLPDYLGIHIRTASRGGAPHALSFSESIYFSIGTISTVGYGDIPP